MINLIFLFEVSDKIPTVEQMYLNGLILGIFILIATFLNRWIGLTFLALALYLSTISMTDSLGADIMPAVIQEMGNNYLKHWNYSAIFSVVLEISSFVAAILLKKRYKKSKVKLT